MFRRGARGADLSDGRVFSVPRTGQRCVGNAGAVTGKQGWGALEGGDNALNTLRLVFAAMMIVSHSWGVASGVKGPCLTWAASQLTAFS